MENEYIENIDEQQIMELYSDIIQEGDYLSACNTHSYYQCSSSGRLMQCIDNCSGSYRVSTTCNTTWQSCK